MKRTSGILIPVTSLPSPFGIGDLGEGAYRFVDFCKASGQRLWQILPINPTDGINGNSPYSSPSAFAGNALFISPDILYQQGLLSKADIARVPQCDEEVIDYQRVSVFKENLLTKAFRNFNQKTHPLAYENFISHSEWLHDYALFVTIKSVYKGASWEQWPMPLRTRQKKALDEFARKNLFEINRIKFIQFVFYQQWVSLKAYANAQGVGIIGDIPIYVNVDSADVWCHPKFFQVDRNGRVKFVSGCPPDYFSKTGQRWGNPTYQWENLKKDKYSWWMKRIEHNLNLFDKLRIDHFRGFIGFWQIPANEKLAVFGKWVKAPGVDFFRVLTKRFGDISLIAEDLGEITPDVHKLMRDFGFPGMRVMLFAFSSDINQNPHVPANYIHHCVAYTGTHDNNTIQGWYKTEAKEFEKVNLTKVLGVKIKPDKIHLAMIEALEQSKAETVIIPMQDILGLGVRARLNTPATKVNNWAWRLKAGQLTVALSKKIKRLSVKAGRYEIK